MRNNLRFTIASVLLLLLIGMACRSAPYFPPSTQTPSSEYGKALLGLREPPLWDNTPCPQCERYRFLWLRSAHRNAVFRVEINHDGEGALIVTLGEVGPRESAERSVKTYRRSLVTAEVEELRAAIKRASFWTIESAPEAGRTDGAHWVFEAQTTDGYRLVDRWSPEPGEYRQLCMLFIRLSGLDVGPIY